MDIPDELDLTGLQSTGLLPGEEELPSESSQASKCEPHPTKMGKKKFSKITKIFNPTLHTEIIQFVNLVCHKVINISVLNG